MTDISIITPFYKGNKYIKNLGNTLCKAIKKIKIQNKNINCEWILVNDSPNCPIDSSLISPKLNYQIISHEKNKGIYEARITGLKRSVGKYILFLDQDDEIDINFFEIMYPLIVSSCSDVAVCNAYTEKKNGELKKLYKTESDLEMITDINAYLKRKNIIQSPGQCLIFKQSIPLEWVDARLKINGSDDLLLWILMLAKKKKFIACSKVLYIHKYTGENLSAAISQMAKSSYEIVDILNKNHSISSEQLDALKRCIHLNTLSKMKRLKYFFKDNDLFRIRLKYELKKLFSKKI